MSEEALSIEVIRDVCMNGPGHFLGHGQTLELMQSEYVYPEIGDRSSPKDWVEQGKPLFGDRAHRKVRETLAQHYPGHITQSIDDAIRQQFPVKLARSDMEPGNGRW